MRNASSQSTSGKSASRSARAGMRPHASQGTEDAKRKRTGRPDGRTTALASRPASSSNRGTTFARRSGAGPVLLGMLVGFLLGILGIVLLRANSLAAGAVAIGGAVALFLYSASQIRDRTLTSEDLPQLTGSWLPLGLSALGIFACAIATYEVSQPRIPANIATAAAAWLLGMIAFSAGIMWLDRWRPGFNRILPWLRSHSIESLILLGIFAIAAVARLYALDAYPIPWSGDEASVGIAGRVVLQSHILDLFSTGWAGQPNPSFYGTSLALAIFGNSILAGRVVSAVIGALTILTVYALGRELFDRTVALSAAAFLALFPYHLQFSRIGVTTIFDAFNITLVLWLVVRAANREHLLDYLLAGVAAGLSFYSFVGSRLVLALAIAAMAYIAIRRPAFLRQRARHLAVFAISAIITAAPIVLFFVQHPDIFMDRLSQVGILFNGWLPREAASTGRSTAAIMLDQFSKSTLVYIAQPARGIFYSSPQPYLTIIGSLCFLIGMGYAFQKLLDVPYAIVLGWFWSVVIFGAVLTLDPPPQTRLFMSSPAVALFVGIGIAKLLDVLGFLKVPVRWQQAAAILLVGILALQNGVFYFLTLRDSDYYQDPNAEVAMQTGLELQHLGPQYSLVLMAEPRMVTAFPTIEFLAPSNPRLDLAPDQASTFDLLQHTPTLVVATPDNVSALQTLANRFPGGNWQTAARIAGPGTLYYAYVLGAQSP